MSLLIASCAGTTTTHIAAEGSEEGSGDTSAGSEGGSGTEASTTAAPDCAAMLPTSAQVGNLLTVLVIEPTNASELVAAGKVNGFGLNGAQRSDVEIAIAEATSDAPFPPFVAVDEEGGDVQRLKWSAGIIPSAEEMGEGTPTDAANTFSDHAERMAALGVNMNYAPVADLGSGSGLGSRTYGDDPARVSEFVVGIIEAQDAQGVTSVVKHWPGIGGGGVDPHEGLTTLNSIDELRAADLIPFQAAIDAGVKGVMVTHAVIPGLTEEGEPATLSRAAITGELRENQGFNGVIFTDALGMGAILDGSTQPEAAVKSVAAGADVVLVTGTDAAEEAHELLVEAIDAGEIDQTQVEESVRRVLTLKGIEGECFDAVSAFAAASKEAEDAEAESTTTTTS